MIVRVVREGPVLPVAGKADRLSLPGVFDGFQLRLPKGGEGDASLFGLPFGLRRPAVRGGQQGQRGSGQCDEAQQDQQIRQHFRILDAIHNHDGEAAKAAMAEHLRMVSLDIKRFFANQEWS